MLSQGWITAEEYLDYRDSFQKLIRGEKIQPVVFKMKINGKWDYNKIHIKIVNQLLKQSYGTGSSSVTVSASIEIAVWTMEKSFEDLYKMADQALYKAKDKGRDRYHIILKDQDRSILHIE